MANKSPLRVLLVEDEALMRWSIAETLTAAGHTVFEADDGATALETLDHDPAVDVVLLDYHLPDADDLTLLSHIRGMLPHTPVVMMTAYGSPELTSDALSLGAYDVLDKPFDLYGLETILEGAHAAGAPH